jgi:RNA polymerase sigma factor (sigma-70 family)
LTDLELSIITGGLKGDRNAQNLLYNHYAPKLMVVCMRFGKNRDEAMEIMQEGFYRIFKNLHLFEFLGNFEGWLRKIMINTAIQRYKDNSKLYAVVSIQREQEELPGTSDTQSMLDVKQMIELVQKLPTSCRLVFNLYVFDGYKHKEIARILGISEGTSKSNLYDARVLLRKALQPKNSRKIKMIN